MKIDKRGTVATIFAVVMLPIILLGFLYRGIEAYFVLGKDICNLAIEAIDEWTDK